MPSPGTWDLNTYFQDKVIAHVLTIWKERGGRSRVGSDRIVKKKLVELRLKQSISGLEWARPWPAYTCNQKEWLSPFPEPRKAPDKVESHCSRTSQMLAPLQTSWRWPHGQNYSNTQIVHTCLSCFLFGMKCWYGLNHDSPEWCQSINHQRNHIYEWALREVMKVNWAPG